MHGAFLALVISLLGTTTVYYHGGAINVVQLVLPGCSGTATTQTKKETEGKNRANGTLNQSANQVRFNLPGTSGDPARICTRGTTRLGARLAARRARVKTAFSSDFEFIHS